MGTGLPDLQGLEEKTTVDFSLQYLHKRAKIRATLQGFKTKLSPKDLKKAEDELNEDPKTRNDKIKEVITRCKASPSIPASCYPRIDIKEDISIKYLLDFIPYELFI